jgi:hypothetical protein
MVESSPEAVPKVVETMVCAPLERLAESSVLAGVAPLLMRTNAEASGAETTVRVVGAETLLAKDRVAAGMVPTVPARTGEAVPVTLAAFALVIPRTGTSARPKAPAATPASIDLLDRIALDNAFPFDASVRRRSDVGIGRYVRSNRLLLG